MSILSRIQGTFSGKTFELAKSQKSVASGDMPNPISVKEWQPSGRVPLVNLEAVWGESPLVFNTVNKLTQLLASVKPKLVADETSVSFFEDFMDNIGSRGGYLTWRNLYSSFFRYQLMYGWHPTEKIFNKDGNKIVDLDIIDPKRFDYLKNKNYNVLMNEYGNPLGYTQTLYLTWTPKQVFELPANAFITAGQIYLPADRVALFKLYTAGDAFYPYGIIEPIYGTYIRHKASEDGLAMAAHRVGNPIPKAEMGDETHEPTDDQLTNAVDELKKMTSKGAYATRYRDKISFLESKFSSEMKSFLDYYIKMEAAGMGVPYSFATGGGDATNRSTLQTQVRLMSLSLRDILETTAETIQKQIFVPIAELETVNGNKITAPKIVYSDVLFEELESKALRLSKYAHEGLIQPDEKLEAQIRESENLPKQEKWMAPIKKIIDTKVKPNDRTQK